MKKFIFLLIILLIGFSVYWFKFRNTNTVANVKNVPLETKKHSLSFNNNLDTLMSAYFNLKNDFIEADSIKAKIDAKKFLSLTDSLNLNELKKETAGILETASSQMNDIKANTTSLLKQVSITEMRQDFRGISESMYPLLRTIHYEGKTLYWQNCPMAFGEGKEGNWISNTDEIINPYLGKKSPEFKSSMLHCGETKDSIKAF